MLLAKVSCGLSDQQTQLISLSYCQGRLNQIECYQLEASRPVWPEQTTVLSIFYRKQGSLMSITRHQTNARMSQIVVHGSTAYLAGQVGTKSESIAEQTAEVLSKIDAHLVSVGSDKTKILQAVIWLDDMRRFDEMNAVWDAWMPEGCAPARACGEVRMASPEFYVEIMVTAAI